jgi:hypothetical protein
MKTNQSSAFLIITTGLLTFVIAVVSSCYLNGPETGQFQIPDTLVVARSSGSEVDVIRWDGAAWSTLVPTNTLVSLIQDAHTYTPRIIKVIPDKRFDNIAIGVLYCADTATEFDSCFDHALIYNAPLDQLTLLASPSGELLVPLRWSSLGTLFAYDFGRGLVEYDAASSTFVPSGMNPGDYTLAADQTGFTADDNLVAYSDEDSERIWSRIQGISQPIPGPASHFNTLWMSFSRDVAPADPKLAIVSQTMATALGGGALRIYDLATATISTVSTSPAPFDYNPAWVDSTRVAFLRGDGEMWGPGVYGSYSELMPSSIQLYDMTTNSVTELIAANGIRRGLIAPDQSGNLVYLKLDSSGISKSHGLSVSGGGESILISDDMTHTALGWRE